jgi:outer membrane protein assembly factor BamB
MNKTGQEVAHVVAAATGKELWNAPFAKSEGDEWGTGPRSAPFIDGDRAYAQSVNWRVSLLQPCRWQSSLGRVFPELRREVRRQQRRRRNAARRGNNGSGLVDGHFVYVPVGAKGASIVCFDKLTGKEIWKALDDEAAYSSFLVATLAGVKQLVGLTA